MNTKHKIGISCVSFIATPYCESENGLVGFTSFILNGSFHIDGIAVRRTRDNRLTLSFPFSRDRSGRQHHYLRPLNDEIRREVEDQVLHALGMKEGAS